MNKEGFFILASFPSPVDLATGNVLNDYYVLARFSDLTEEEVGWVADAVEKDLADIEPRPLLCVEKESKAREDMGRFLVWYRMAQETEDKIRSNPKETFRSNLHYRLAHSAMKYAEKVRKLRNPSGSEPEPVISAKDELRHSRLRELHRRTLEASRDCPMWHFAVEASSQRINSALWPYMPPLRASEPFAAAIRHYWGSPKSHAAAKRRFCMSFLGQTDISHSGVLVPVETAPVTVDSAVWIGCYVIPVEGEEDVALRFSKSWGLLGEIGNEASQDCGATDRVNPWLSFLYRKFPGKRKNLPSQQCGVMLPEFEPGESAILTWLPWDVFLTSARAIESLFESPPEKPPGDRAGDTVIATSGAERDRVSQESSDAKSATVPDQAPSGAQPVRQDRLSQAEQRIIDVIRDCGERMTTKRILTALEREYGAASEGTTKTCLAGLVRRGLLTNRQDVIPKGYGLPEWD